MKTTPLHGKHLDLKAKMAEFAGYDMPIQYETGVLAEHNWTRERAGLFDVSHMGQVVVQGAGSLAFWEKLTPSAIGKLGHNVAKYTGPNTRVTISATASNDLVQVTVDDDGPGLPPRDRPRLVDKFQRGDDEGATIGAGLGLAICRAIVRAHGSEIGSVERPGGGARFVFTLHVIEAAP